MPPDDLTLYLTKLGQEVEENASSRFSLPLPTKQESASLASIMQAALIAGCTLVNTKLLKDALRFVGHYGIPAFQLRRKKSRRKHTQKMLRPTGMVDLGYSEMVPLDREK